MGKSSSNVAEFKARLQLALSRAKPRHVSNLTEFADICGMTPANLRKTYINPDPKFPLNSVGSNGRDYQIPTQKSLKHLISACDKKLATASSRSNEMADIIGVSLPATEQGGSLSDLNMMTRMTISVVQEREKQGGYIPVPVVKDFIGGFCSSVTRSILGVKVQVDPTGSLPPEVASDMEEYLRRVAAAAQTAAAKFVEEYDARSKQGRTH